MNKNTNDDIFSATFSSRTRAHKAAYVALEFYDTSVLIYCFSKWLEDHDKHEAYDILYNMRDDDSYDREKLVRSVEFKRLFIENVVHQAPDGRWALHRIGRLIPIPSITPTVDSGTAQPPSANTATKKTGGRPTEPFNQAITRLFETLLASGETDLLREENIDGFIKRLQDSVKETGKHADEYIIERIKKVTCRGAATGKPTWEITTNRLPYEKRRNSNHPSTKKDKSAVVKILKDLRKKNNLA